MASEQLEQWLEKYWQGELTLVEEMQFRTALKINKASLKGELRSLSEWFEANENARQQISLGDDFDEMVLNKTTRKSNLGLGWSWWKIAASVLIIISLGYMAWLLPQQNNESKIVTEINNTQETPEKAFEETKATLLLMANMMNSGKEHLNSLQLFQVAQDKIQNSLKKEKSKKEKNIENNI
jgi:hypothetical protein